MKQVQEFNSENYRFDPTETYTGKIATIKEGRLREFVTPEALAKFTYSSPDDETLMIEVEYVLNDKTQTYSEMFSPAKGPSSKFQKFLRKYQRMSVGTKVLLGYNEEGFLRIII